MISFVGQCGQCGLALKKKASTKNMFYVVESEKKELAAPPVIWTKICTTGVGYYWPLYGLHFKLKNLAPLPIDTEELMREWKWNGGCKILFNRGIYFKASFSIDDS